MIKSFRHRGLKRLYERGDRSKITAAHADKIERILMTLDNAASIDGMNLPGYGLHALSGDLKNYWAVKVTGNWRIVFQFNTGAAENVDLVDYH